MGSFFAWAVTRTSTRVLRFRRGFAYDTPVSKEAFFENGMVARLTIIAAMAFALLAATNECVLSEIKTEYTKIRDCL